LLLQHDGDAIGNRLFFFAEGGSVEFAEVEARR
jgi:hypothetical protein